MAQTQKPQYRDYTSSAAYQRSQKLRPDGSPVWPVKPEEIGLFRSVP